MIIGIGLASFITWKLLSKKIKTLEETNKKQEFQLRSAYVKFGKSFEHFIPFCKDFPGDKENTVFLGMPLDFISFNQDKIIFIEAKTGDSKLSQKQKRIKKLIEEGKVEFKEVHYNYL